MKYKESILNDEININNFKENGICIKEFNVNREFFFGINAEELFGKLELPIELEYPEIELGDLSKETIESLIIHLKHSENEEIKFGEIISEYGSGHWIDKNKYFKVKSLLSDINLSKFTNTVCIIFMVHTLFKKGLTLTPYDFKLSQYTELELFSKKILNLKSKGQVQLYKSNKLIHRLNQNESTLLSEIINYFFYNTEKGQLLLLANQHKDKENRLLAEKTANLGLKNKANLINKRRTFFIEKFYNSIAKSIPKVKVRLVLIGKLLQVFNDIKSYDEGWDKGYKNEEDYYYNVLRPLVKKVR